MGKKVIKGNVIPTIKSVVDELKYLKNEFADTRNVAIEIASDGNVYGGYKLTDVVGNHNGEVYGSFQGLSSASDYRLRQIAKNIIEHHIWRIENGFFLMED